MTIRIGTPQGKAHSAKSGVHRDCSGGNIILLICHVILQDHKIFG